MAVSTALAEPFLIERNLTLSPKTVGLASRAEIALARADSLVANSSHRRILIKLSSLLEAVATQPCDKPETMLSNFFYKQWLGQGYAAELPSSFNEGGALHELRFEEALHFVDTTLWASKYVSPKNRLNAELLLDIRSRLLFKRSHHQTSADFRTVALGKCAQTNLGPATAPDAERVFPLMMDLCDFINQDMYSPLVQAAIASCQLEWIAPFGEEIWLSRALTQLVFCRRGLLHSTVLPFSLLACVVPDASTKLRDTTLAPLEELSNAELLKRLNALVSLYAGSAELAAQMLFALDKLFDSLLVEWTERFDRLFKGSLLEEMLSLLFIHPIVSVESLCALTGRSFTTVNDAVTRLLDAEILVKHRADCARSRVFVAEEVLKGYEKILERLLPQFLLSSAFKAQILN